METGGRLAHIFGKRILKVYLILIYLIVT